MPMTKKLSWVFLIFLFALPLSCKFCAKSEKTDLTMLIPGDSALVVLLPDLASTIADLNSLLQRFSVGPVATIVNQAKIQAEKVMGFDPLNVEAWRKVGMNPEGGLAIFSDAEKNIFAVVSIENEKAFETFFLQKSKEIGGISHAIAGDHTWIGVELSSKETAARLQKLPATESLASAAWYRTLKNKNPKDADLLLAINPAAVRNNPFPGFNYLKDGMLLSFSVDKDRLSAVEFFSLTPDFSSKLTGLSEGIPDAHLERTLPDDTAFIFKARLDPGKILDLVFGLHDRAKPDFEREMAMASEKLGGNMEKGLIRNLTGNGVLGISLGTSERIGKLMGSGNPKDAAKAFKLFGWVQVKDVAAYQALVDKAISTAPAAEVQINRSKLGALNVIDINTKDGLRTELLSSNDLVGFCFGEGCAEISAKLLDGQAPNLTQVLSPQTKVTFSEPSAVAFMLNFDPILKIVSSLDAGLFGKGGIMVKMFLDMAMTAVRNLKELDIRILFSPEGMTLEGGLRLQ
jgi:hypothetical protein